MVGEGLQERDVLIAEGDAVVAVDDDRAERAAVPHQRHRDGGDALGARAGRPMGGLTPAV
jgi:hypothetical protein